MSGGARIGLVVAAVAVLVVAFALLSGGDDSEPTATATSAAEPTPEAVAPPAAEFNRIRVQAGKPQGGVRTITVEQGERVRIQVASQDTSDEVHLHGYDISRELEAGDSVRFSFDADAEGVFEIELERAKRQIAELVVEP